MHLAERLRRGQGGMAREWAAWKAGRIPHGKKTGQTARARAGLRRGRAVWWNAPPDPGGRRPTPLDTPPVNTAPDLPWRLPAYALWLALFALGFAPEETFHLLRDWGGVTTQRALVNSPHLITLGLAVYLGIYTYFRAREAGCDQHEARGKATQMACVGLVAFADVPVAFLLQMDELRVAFHRNLLLGLVAVKFLAWTYALAILFRYHFLGGPAVFARMGNLFPSARRASDPEAAAPAAEDPAQPK